MLLSNTEATNNQYLGEWGQQSRQGAPGQHWQQAKPRLVKKNKQQVFVETQLEQIGYKASQPSAFKITAHYKQMFKVKDHDHNETVFERQPFSSESQSPSAFSNAQEESATLVARQADGSEAVNRLLQMTKRISENFDNIFKYKRARDQVLDQIKKNRERLNYVIHPEIDRPTDEKESSSQQTTDEVELGSHGEYVLSQNQVIQSPNGTEYKIIQFLGQGTFGQVVKCVNVQTGSLHAVKIIKNKQDYTI